MVQWTLSFHNLHIEEIIWEITYECRLSVGVRIVAFTIKSYPKYWLTDYQLLYLLIHVFIWKNLLKFLFSSIWFGLVVLKIMTNRVCNLVAYKAWKWDMMDLWMHCQILFCSCYSLCCSYILITLTPPPPPKFFKFWFSPLVLLFLFSKVFLTCSSFQHGSWVPFLSRCNYHLDMCMVLFWFLPYWTSSS